MKERPILFSGPMVRALLAGTKMQTRRIVNVIESGGMSLIRKPKSGECLHLAGGQWCWRPYGGSPDQPYPNIAEYSPYGQPGDRLWVREEHHITLRDPRAVSVRYMADDEVVTEVTIGPREHALFIARKRRDATTRARFMWRCLSRIILEIVSVRVERLQDISEGDAIAEGIRSFTMRKSCGESKLYGVSLDQAEHGTTARCGYEILWESINGAGSWAENPWVWAIEFRRVTQ